MNNSEYINKLMAKFAAAKQADGPTNITGFENAQVRTGVERGPHWKGWGPVSLPYLRLGDVANTALHGGTLFTDPNNPNEAVAEVIGGPAGANWLNTLGDVAIGTAVAGGIDNAQAFARNYARNFNDMGSAIPFMQRFRQAYNSTINPVGSLPEAQLRSFLNSRGAGSGAQTIGEGVPAAPRSQIGERTLGLRGQNITPAANPVKIDANQAALIYRLKADNPGLRGVSSNDLARLITDPTVGQERIHEYVAYKQLYPDMTVDQFKAHTNPTVPIATSFPGFPLKAPVEPVKPVTTQEIQEDPLTGQKTKIDVSPTPQQIAEYDAAKKQYDADLIKYTDAINQLKRTEQAAIVRAQTPRTAADIKPGDIPVTRVFNEHSPQVTGDQGWWGRSWDWVTNKFLNKNIDASRPAMAHSRIPSWAYPVLGSFYTAPDLVFAYPTRETVGVESEPGAGITPLTQPSQAAIRSLGQGAEGSPKLQP